MNGSVCQNCDYLTHCSMVSAEENNRIELMALLHQTANPSIIARIMGCSESRAKWITEHLDRVWHHCKIVV